MSHDSKAVSRHILVVDDDDLLRKAVVRMLRNASHTVISEASGATAAAEIFLGNKSINVVISDAQMNPNGKTGEDGHNLLALIHAELVVRNGLFIAMTGSFDHRVHAPFHKHNVPVISKPFDVHELLAHFK